jgi:hypothetical protein
MMYKNTLILNKNDEDLIMLKTIVDSLELWCLVIIRAISIQENILEIQFQCPKGYPTDNFERDKRAFLDSCVTYPTSDSGGIILNIVEKNR